MVEATGQPPSPENPSSETRGITATSTQGQEAKMSDEEFESIIEGLEATSKAFRSLVNQNALLKRKYDASLAEYERLKSEFEELRKAYSTAKQYIDRAKAVEEENIGLRKAMESSFSSREAEGWRNELEQIRASRIGLERSLLESRKATEDLQSQNQKLTALNQSLNGRIEDLNIEKVKANEKIQLLTKEIGDLNLERERVATECNGVREGYEALKREYESLKTKLSKIPKVTID